MRVSLRHLCCLVSQEFSNRVQADTRPNKSTGESVSVAMPRIVSDAITFNSIHEPSTRALYGLCCLSAVREDRV
jgi:hypothetical protein